MSVANPFPGLRPFRDDEVHLFFGRESQVDALVDRLAASRLLAVVGTSGCGKSSLVNCGLRPALQRGLMAGAGSAWRIIQFRPGSSPLRSLADALARPGALFGGDLGSGPTSLADMIDATLRLSRRGLVDVCEMAQLGPDANVLVIVDQFEELFRFRASTAQAAEETVAFVNLLIEAAAQTALPIYVALTMRSDFLGDCAQLPGLPEAINRGQYLVPRMSRDERRQAIVGPAAVSETESNPTLVTRIVNDVGDNPDQLSIMQHALNRTWARWQRNGREGHMSLPDYEAIGTMADALDQHAERAYAELTTDRQRGICELLFKALTDKGSDVRGIRRPARMSTLCALTGATLAEVQRVIDVFRKPSRSFLMPPLPEPLTPGTIVDISHESLMRVWHRLKTWVDEEAESAKLYLRLVQSAEMFDRGKAVLLVDPELSMLLDWQQGKGSGTGREPGAAWAERYHPGFASAIGYLDRSREVRDAARLLEETRRTKKERRDRMIGRISRGALLWVAILAGVGVVWHSWRANAHLEAAARDATRDVDGFMTNGGGLPTGNELRALDGLRAIVDSIDVYRRGDVPRLRLWRLYAGRAAYADARAAYWRGFNYKMFDSTRAHMIERLRTAGSSSRWDESGYGEVYSRLKAYLITTSNPEKSAREFLTPVLMAEWLAGRSLDPQLDAVARRQFDQFADQLQLGHQPPQSPDAALVAQTRALLNRSPGSERIYQAMLAEATKTSDAIQFSHVAPAAARVLTDGHVVPGAFTQRGATFMLEAVKLVDRYLNGEAWVVGPDAAAVDKVALVAELTRRYALDYRQQWRDFLSEAYVVPPANLKDASANIAAMSGSQSPLIALFTTVSQNTDGDRPGIESAFEAVHRIVRPGGASGQVTIAGSQWVRQLGLLQASLDQVIAAPDSVVALPISNARAQMTRVRMAVSNMAAGVPADKDSLSAIVWALAVRPMDFVEPLLHRRETTLTAATTRLYSAALDEMDRGNKAKAIELLKQVLVASPGFEPAVKNLNKLGVSWP